MPVNVGVIADISGIMGKDGVDRFRLSVGSLYDCFIGEKSAHGLTPPFPPAVGTSQGKCAVRLCCVSVRTACRFPHGLNVQEVQGDDFLLCFRQSGQSDNKVWIAQHDSLTADRKRIFLA